MYMVYITGDTHGDIVRFLDEFCQTNPNGRRAIIS